MYRSGALESAHVEHPRSDHAPGTSRRHHVEELPFGHGDLRDVRRLVASLAHAAGLPASRADDLVLAVNELAANSVDHGGGHGVLRAWTERSAFVVEVHDRGSLPDIQAVPRQPAPDADRGRGLWLAYRLADLVQVRRTESGTVARVVTWLHRA